jgi:DNA-binding FadR family transcriptional regulator
VEHLRREVALGRLSPGDKLPAERQLAEQLGVARETLRQALRVMEGAGELSIQRGASGGAFLLAPQADPTARARALLGRRDEILQLVQFRDIVESAAAKLAAASVTDALLKRLDEAIEDMDAASTLAESRRADTLFHLAIAEGSGNDLLVRAIEDARVRMFEPVDALAVDFVKSSSIAAHRALRNAIAAGDGEKAEREMREHLAVTTAEFERLIEA